MTSKEQISNWEDEVNAARYLTCDIQVRYKSIVVGKSIQNEVLVIKSLVDHDRPD